MNAVNEVGSKIQEQGKSQKIDFKMISFVLAGKDYGIDIMKVKEIRKAGNFTKVPNTAVYVRGVDNLRGDIIPIIDLRIFFNLPAERVESGTLENIIILNLDDLIIGVIVDNIEKVIGIDSSNIQPPHPIFGDINIRYINGVVENNGRLYIILDVDRVLGRKQIEEKKVEAPASKAAADIQSPIVEEEKSQIIPQQDNSNTQADLDYQFVTENLATFGDFFVSPVNKKWVQNRLTSWKQERSSKNISVQFSSRDEAWQFLKGFSSPFSGTICSGEALESLSKLVEFNSGTPTVWNPGCGKGYETYSIALLFEKYFPGKAYKIWANENDLMNISLAPSLSLEKDEIDSAFASFVVQTKNGFQFSSEIKSHILFEYHDIKNLNPFTDLDLIIARDVISFFKPQEQEALLIDFQDKLKKGGYLILGQNEEVSVNTEDWEKIGQSDWVIYKKRA